MLPDSRRAHDDDLISFIAASPSPYHAVAESALRLEAAGFCKLFESDDWADATGGCYVVRDAALVAWYAHPDTPPEAPLALIEARTDSPNLRIHPAPDTAAAGWRRIAVTPYADCSPEPWYDRDLGVSGRLLLRDGTTRLACLDEPLLRLAGPPAGPAGHGTAADPGRARRLAPLWGLGGADPGALLARVAEQSGTDSYEVLGWDLMLHDVQEPGFLGGRSEFLVSARLDNLLALHAGLAALTAAAHHVSGGRAGRTAGPVPVLVAADDAGRGGGATTSGSGVFAARTLRRAAEARGAGSSHWYRSLATGYRVHTGLTPAVHPDLPDRHDPGHRPLPNGGPVITLDGRDPHGTGGRGLAAFAAACERAGVPWQTYVPEETGPCARGRTATPGNGAGPAGGIGLTSIAAGVAALSAHTPRELCGAGDAWLLARTLTAFATAADGA
ncbi:M18 family aminopeptidase [Streptomyces sp. NPDC002044]|uniref:M18 family aminopeptidase n=1 Tax=Streptomyces sp. NPDC002044 TaxID=3154662 RepID=UPI003321F22A